MKPQPHGLPAGAYCNPYNGNFHHFTFWTSDNRMILGCGGNIKGTCHWKPPHGLPGDRLWVRETFYNDIPEERNLEHIYYRADGECCEQIPECQCASVGKVKWKPAIYMPRWASRLTLEVTAVRVERLQDISEDDAKAEGCGGYVYGHGPVDEGALQVEPGYWHDRFFRAGYEHGWDALNEKRGFGWASNPWVWCVTFKRAGAPADEKGE